MGYKWRLGQVFSMQSSGWVFSHSAVWLTETYGARLRGFLAPSAGTAFHGCASLHYRGTMENTASLRNAYKNPAPDATCHIVYVITELLQENVLEAVMGEL